INGMVAIQMLHQPGIQGQFGHTSPASWDEEQRHLRSAAPHFHKNRVRTLLSLPVPKKDRQLRHRWMLEQTHQRERLVECLLQQNKELHGHQRIATTIKEVVLQTYWTHTQYPLEYSQQTLDVVS